MDAIARGFQRALNSFAPEQLRPTPAASALDP